jgi:carbon starvation protein CstA
MACEEWLVPSVEQRIFFVMTLSFETIATARPVAGPVKAAIWGIH